MEYIQALENALGKTAEKEYLPIQPGDVPYTEANAEDLMRNMGNKPNASIEKGLEALIEWFSNYYSIANNKECYSSVRSSQ